MEVGMVFLIIPVAGVIAALFLAIVLMRRRR
jgi:hypothetical protein